MRYFTDSALLILYSMLAFFYVSVNQALVFSLLLAMILICLTYICRKQPLLDLCYLLFLVGSILVPDLGLFFPLLFYQTFYGKRFLFSAVLIPAAFFLFSHSDIYVKEVCCFELFGFLLAFSLWCYAKKRDTLDQELRQIQDDSEEHTLLLAEKNKALLEKQDSEIYAATLRERNRIAREIHDNVGHVLSRSILLTAALKTINKEAALMPLLDNLETSLNNAMNSIRSSVHDLRDDSVNLEDAIRTLVNDFTFCPVSLTYDMSRQLPKEVKYTLITITKEGLSNVMRHSNASSVTILFREHPALYQFCMEDNGTRSSPFSTDPEASGSTPEGMGLSNIRHRVNALNGTVQITAAQGFRIFVTIPRR